LGENYNMWVPFADKYPQNDVKVLHYIGKIKPFTNKQYPVGCTELVRKYYKLYFDYLEVI